MLSPNDKKTILRVTNEYWSKHVDDRVFTELVAGKEPGHRMADYVDDKTVSLMKVNLDTRYEASPRGEVKKRSMGDVWIHSNGMFNPLNVKAGEQEKNGQPNLVSMQKLLHYIFNRWIDSYYLLIVKFRIGTPITHKEYLIDLLDWTQFVTFDAGPGQIMLREREFYEAYDTQKPAQRSIVDKVDDLFKLFEDGIVSLFSNRKRRLSRQRKSFGAFRSRGDFTVDQSSMRFTP